MTLAIVRIEAGRRIGVLQVVPAIRFVAIAALVVLGAVLELRSTLAVEIRLKAEHDCTENLVTLGQVATLLGDEEEVQRMARIQLFPAPGKGRERTVRAGEVHELLRLHGFDPLEHRISGAATTTVRRARAFAKPTENDPNKRPPVAVVAAHGLLPGQIIREADVKVIEFRHRPQGLRLAYEVKEVIGRETTRPIAAGQVVELGQLRRPIAVRRQTQITIFSRASGVEVRTLARALEDGAVGDLIQVESIATKEKYAARVSGIQQAEVFASGSTVPRTATYTRITRTPTNPGGVRVSRADDVPNLLER